MLANCESQLKAQTELKDFSLIPQAKTRTTGWWKWVAIAALALPLSVFGLMSLNDPGPRLSVAGKETSNVNKPEMPRQVTALGITESDGWVQLFDGKDLTKWTSGGGEAKWKIENGYMEVAPKTGSIQTKERFADFQLHIEFATPVEVKGNGQGRGNSGILMNGVYEIQVLDCYDNPTYPDGQAGGLYGQSPPLVNASKKPGEWQSYDIIWESPRWDADKKIAKKAAVTVIHNGVVLHHRKEFTGTTPHQPSRVEERP